MIRGTRKDTNPATKETRDDVLRPLLRGGETYESLLRKMGARYDPDETTPREV